MVVLAGAPRRLARERGTGFLPVTRPEPVDLMVGFFRRPGQ